MDQMEHVAWHRGLEICRTSAGHIVVVDPHERWEQRACLVEMLADANWLDSLFFPTIADALDSIDEYVAESDKR